MLASKAMLTASRALFATLALFIVTAAAIACGDGAATPPTPTTTTGAAGSPTANGFSPEPRLTSGKLVAFFPLHASAVTKAELTAVNPMGVKGVCFAASFEGLAEEARSFTMRVDNREATLDFAWTYAAAGNPRPPRACYELSEGLAVGRHTVAVAIRTSSDLTRPPIETVTWQFEVK